MVRLKNREQIIRLDGKSEFVEVLDNAFGIEKVMFQFVKYDPVSNKQISILPFYLDFTDFLVLEHDVLSGRIGKLAEIERQKNQGGGFPKDIFMKQGGVSAEALHARGMSRPDGAPLSRVLKIIPGKKLLFQAEQGKGEKMDKGLIKSVFGTKPDIRIMIPLSDEQLKAMVLMVGSKIRAYYAAGYVFHQKENFNRQVSDDLARKESYRK